MTNLNRRFMAIYFLKPITEESTKLLMKKKEKSPFISVPRNQTLRQSMILIMEEREVSARELSAETGIREKEVYDHLEHIRKTMGKDFIITPAQCRKCHFIFEKRNRLKKPGRCPLCHSEIIEAPLFKIKSLS